MEDSTAHAAVPIVFQNEQKNKFLLEEKILEKILLQEDIADRIAIPITVTGAFRQGKSFLLDFFIRYLEFTSNPSTQGTDDWLGDENSPLRGFSWRGGSERNTTGIQMWSNIFKVDLPTGEKAAVILLDTQGAFDDKTTVRESATIFALSTMLSSIQIFNLFNNLREDHLQHLELFTEYGRLLEHDVGQKPFQKLQFLIRDWSWPYEKNYGSEGGRALLEERLKISDEHATEQQSLRNNINSCFTDIQCFLMPHPGSKVTTNPNFDGKLSDIDEDFKAHLKQFVPMLLSDKNLVPKEIGSQKIKVKELLVYLKRYMELFNREDLPEPKSIFLATAEANILLAVTTAREYFNHSILEAIKSREPYFTCQELEEQYGKSSTETIEQFDEKPKMGGDEFIHRYRPMLIEAIERDYNLFKIFNGGKAEASNQQGIAAGKESYIRNMTSTCESVEPYLSLDQFKQDHEKYAQEALTKFRKYSKIGEDEISITYLQKLEQDIVVEHDRFFAFNKNKAETNNRTAIVASTEMYHKKMSEIVQNIKDDTFLSSEKLEQIHEECKTEAIEHFDHRSISNGDKFSITFKTNLEKDIDEDYEHFKSFYKTKMKTYILSTTAVVKETYHRNMNAIYEAAYPYLTNSEMEENHARCQTEAMLKITANREFPESYEIKLKELIYIDYHRFKHLNKSKAEAHNQLAFSSAKEVYYRQMTILFENPLSHFEDDVFEQEHQKCKSAALEQFTKQYKKRPDEFSEAYLIKLDNEIETDRNWFKTHNDCKKKFAHAIPTPTEPSMIERFIGSIDRYSVAATAIGGLAYGPAGAALGAVCGGISKLFRR